MRTWLLWLGLLVASLGLACLRVEDFKEQQFRCSEDQDCPQGSWCHAKRLVTGGDEGGNICVPRGQHWCEGQLCPEDQRCASDGTGGSTGGDTGGSTAQCVSCPGCEPWRSNNGGGGNGGGGNGGGGPNNDCANCGGGTQCVGGSCVTPCSGPPKPNCDACRYTPNINPGDNGSGGGCFPAPGAGCSTQDCNSGSCAVFLDADGGASVSCAMGSGNNRDMPCAWSGQCLSGICANGTCREACSTSRAGCNCNEGDSRMPLGTGWCL